MAAFDAILASAPASLQFLSQRTGLAPVVVADATNHLVDLGLLACNEAGLVVGSWGLTLVPTSHQLRMLGGSYYTWCAEDAVGIPAALNVDAAIASSCFQCGQKVAIELEHGEVVKAMPQDRVIDGKRRMIKRWQNGKSSCGGWWHRRS
ncbi:MAG: organomercurial lyase [Dehalococcoidales bacterium]|nr:organomercurial lyase [Dehalococcoidales bacterium]